MGTTPKRVTRRIEFDAGHRLIQHGGKCRNYHGHRYVVDIMCEVDAIGADGMVIDFGVVKSRVGSWVDAHLDHAMILQEGDPMVQLLVDRRMAHYVMEKPPTAEHLADLIHSVAESLLANVVRVANVRVYETPNCWADSR